MDIPAIQRSGSTRTRVARLLLVLTAGAVTLSGCLYKYLDYKWKPSRIEGNGFAISIGPNRLYHSAGGYVDGTIEDSASTHWGLGWFVFVDDSLTSVDHVRCDSVRIVFVDRGDSLGCDSRVVVSAETRWYGSWPCRKISLAEMHQEVELRMVVTLVYGDGSESDGSLCSTRGKPKTTRVHSDY